MARQKTLKPVSEYLKPRNRGPSPDGALLAMFRELKKRGGNVEIRRLKKKRS